jgi:hypothetical protein
MTVGICHASTGMNADTFPNMKLFGGDKVRFLCVIRNHSLSAKSQEIVLQSMPIHNRSLARVEMLR